MLRDPGRVRAALRRLPGPALVLLEILCEIPDRLLSHAACREEVDRRLGRSGWGHHAIAALADASLVLQPARADLQTDDLALLPEPLAGALGPFVAGVSLRPVDPTTVRVERRADARSPDLRLAVLIGAFWNDPPRITADGAVFKVARDKLARIYFPGDDGAGARFLRLIMLAEAAGALDFGPNTVVVRREAAAAWAALPPERRTAARLALAARGLGEEGLAAFARLLEAGGEGWVRSAELVDRVRPTMRARGLHEWWGGADRIPPAGVDRLCTRTLEFLRSLPEVEVGKAGEEDEVLRIPPALRAPPPLASVGRAYVQPNFEVLLPPDADFAAALGVASIAELRRVEDVALLAVTPASVRRARDNGLGREEILGALEAVAPGAVPQNVAATVAQWAGGPRAARLVDAAVLYCPDPGAAAAARAAPGVASLLGPEVGPGLWAIDRYKLGPLSEALGRAGIEHLARPIHVEQEDRYRPHRQGLDEMIASGPACGPHEPAENELRRAVAAAHGSSPPRPPSLPAPSSRKSGPSAPVRLLPRTPSRPDLRIPLLDFDLDEDEDEDDDEDEEFSEEETGIDRILPPDARHWLPAPEPGALRMLLEECLGDLVEVEVEEDGGGRVRREVLVERVGSRRGRWFLDGFCVEPEEGVSIPVDRIRALAAADEGAAATLRALLLGETAPPPAPAARPGRNDPCPCGSGRKFKRCCGR